MTLEQLALTALHAAIGAGKKILEVYNSNSFEVEIKEDKSPLTLADRRAHHIINQALSQTEIPVLSEEGSNHDYEIRKHWNKVWIVDPLDGTKEFISRNGEFSVNIALIENSKPILGILLAPVSGRCYVGIVGNAAFVLENAMSVHCNTFAELRNSAKAIRTSSMVAEEMVIVASRSHRSPETDQYIAEVSNQYATRLVSIGSALKMGLIAEGAAHLYPRFAPTMEWDVAAGHAIIAAAGGIVLDASNNKPLVYNKFSLKNPWFIAKG